MPEDLGVAMDASTIDLEGGQTPRDDEVPGFDTARRALATLLTGFGVPRGPQLDVAAGRLARRLPPLAEGGEEEPLALADAELRLWLGAVLGLENTPELPAIGRAAYLACDGPRKWAGCLLADPPPPAFVGAMRAAMPPLTPPERPGAMVEQSLASWSAAGLRPSTLLGRLLRPVARDAPAG